MVIWLWPSDPTDHFAKLPRDNSKSHLDSKGSCYLLWEISTAFFQIHDNLFLYTPNDKTHVYDRILRPLKTLNDYMGVCVL